jgi:hypothetical protein
MQVRFAANTSSLYSNNTAGALELLTIRDLVVRRQQVL